MTTTFVKSTESEKFKSFCDLSIGEGFRWRGNEYLKTSYSKQSSNSLNLVHMKTKIMESHEQVLPINLKIIEE